METKPKLRKQLLWGISTVDILCFQTLFSDWKQLGGLLNRETWQSVEWKNVIQEIQASFRSSGCLHVFFRAIFKHV